MALCRLSAANSSTLDVIRHVLDVSSCPVVFPCGVEDVQLHMRFVCLLLCVHV